VPDDVVRVNGLVKRYGDVAVIDGVGFTIGRGEIFGLLGPNGAGKTTLIECIVGLRQPTAGTIDVLGFDPARDRTEITTRVAVQTQSASLFDTLTVADTMRLFASFHAAPNDPVEVAQAVGLGEQRNVRTKNLSGGQYRRLLLGVALVADPQIIVLDEPSAGLDPVARRELWALVRGLRDAGTTVLLSTHHMDEATELCDRVAILIAGRVVALDSPAELVLQRSADSTVSFTVPASAEPAVLAAFVDAAATTREEVRDGVRVTLAAPDPDELLRRITFTRGLAARDISIHRGSLEDIFVELAETREAS
jgi:ABC-2 type transport system ATP-binding protein